MQPGRTTNTGGGTMEVKAAAPRCQLLLILLMSVVMLLPGTNGSLLLVQRTVTRTIVLQETIGKEKFHGVLRRSFDLVDLPIGESGVLKSPTINVFVDLMLESSF
ncbi:hypothetical protein STEG23_032959 [Scotinomys teguina]